MKTFLLTLLLLTSAAQADQWLVNGRTYNGTIHKFSPDGTQIYVTSDWDNYSGSWIKVAELDPATRVRLNIATPQEQAVVKAQMEQLRQYEAQAAAQAQARAIADRAARIEEQKLALEREKLELQRQQEANRQQEARRAAQNSQRSSTQIYIVPVVPRYPQNGYPQNGYPRVPQAPQPIFIR
jgi:hypothetical protein